MKQFLTLVLVAVLFASCKEKTKEDYIKDAFMDYVKTDFDDPSEFEDITSIAAKDTLDNRLTLSIIEQIEGISVLFTSAQVAKIADYKSQIERDNTFVIEYRLKARIKRNGRKFVQTYYVLDDGTDYKVRDYEMTMNDLPELYKEFYKFASELIN